MCVRERERESLAPAPNHPDYPVPSQPSTRLTPPRVDQQPRPVRLSESESEGENENESGNDGEHESERVRERERERERKKRTCPKPSSPSSSEPAVDTPNAPPSPNTTASISDPECLGHASGNQGAFRERVSA